MDISQLLEQHVDLIDGIIQTACRKKNIAGEQARDFRSYVYEKLLENDAKRLRDFQGDYKSSWASYLTIVITRLAIDFIKKHWGRWENSTAARLLGEAAMKLETLIYRDNYAFREAVEILRQSPEYATMYRLSAAELDQLQGVLPATTYKRLTSLEKQTLFSEKEYEARLQEVLSPADNHLLDIIIETTRIELSQDLLAAWDMLFQGRMPVRRTLTTTISASKSLEDTELNVIENIADSGESSPLDKLLNKEMETLLDQIIDRVLQTIDRSDWAIISFYLIDNLRISEIARMLDTQKADMPAGNPKKAPVSSKSWKYVNKRVTHVHTLLKREVEQLDINKMEWEAVSRYCLYLISKKIQKKERGTSST